MWLLIDWLTSCCKVTVTIYVICCTLFWSRKVHYFDTLRRKQVLYSGDDAEERASSSSSVLMWRWCHSGDLHRWIIHISSPWVRVPVTEPSHGGFIPKWCSFSRTQQTRTGLRPREHRKESVEKVPDKKKQTRPEETEQKEPAEQPSTVPAPGGSSPR